MKKAIALVLALVMCLSLAACGGGNGKDKMLTKEELMNQAVVIKADEITKNIGKNFASASKYKDKTYSITGHVREINDEYCILLGAAVDSDKHLHQDEWREYGLETVFHVYLPLDELARLSECQNIEVVGIITDVSRNKYHAIENQIQLSVTNAYIVRSSNVRYEGRDGLADLFN